jgi:hypothetical protein
MFASLNSPIILATPLLPVVLATPLLLHPANTHRRGGFLRKQGCCQPVAAPDDNTTAPLVGRGVVGESCQESFSLCGWKQPTSRSTNERACLCLTN